MLYYKMVLSEEQKKQLVERLKAGREAKKAAVEAPKKAEKVTKAAPPKPAPKAPPKPAPVENPPVIPFEEPLPPPVIADEPPKKVAPPVIADEAQKKHGGQGGNGEFSPSPSRKDKRLNKQKYMAIKFYEKPGPSLYKKVMRSVQESSSEDEPMELDYEAAPKVKITEAERARVAAEIEAKKRDAIYKLLG